MSKNIGSKPLLGNIPGIDLRQARQSDYRFAETLYVDSMRSLLTELGEWNESEIVSKLKHHFELDEVQIIMVDGTDVGWLQISETEHAINLDQLYLLEGFRAQRIGSRLIQCLLATAKSEKKPVLLSVVRNNVAVTLYQRLGFRITEEEGYKLHMRWDEP